MNTKSRPELSSGFISWMIRHQVSVVCSSYQTGRLVFIGAQKNGAATFSLAQFPGAMGLAVFFPANLSCRTLRDMATGKYVAPR